MLKKEEVDFLSKMADLSVKEMKILNVGDRIADWFDKHITTSWFLLGWFWTVLGVCFLFFVFMPVFYLIDLGFRFVEWRVERKYKHSCKESGR